MKLGISNHLDSRGKGMLGSYYTPNKYVETVARWLRNSIEKGETILDPSCGYGAFFAIEDFSPKPGISGTTLMRKRSDRPKRTFPRSSSIVSAP